MVAGMNRARVWFSPGLGLWIGYYKLPTGYVITSNGMNAAAAYDNLIALHRRHAESQRNAPSAEPGPTGQARHQASYPGHDAGRDPAPGDRDEAFDCPCGCGCTLIVNFARQRTAWVRHGYAYSWHSQNALNGTDQAAAIPARSRPGSGDRSSVRYWLGRSVIVPGGFIADGRRYTWAEIDAETQAESEG